MTLPSHLSAYWSLVTERFHARSETFGPQFSNPEFSDDPPAPSPALFSSTQVRGLSFPFLFFSRPPPGFYASDYQKGSK